MSRQIDYRYSASYPAATVYATLVDRTFIEARIREIGGADAELVEHHADDTGARYVLRDQLDTSGLPPMVRSFVPRTLGVQRTEVWKAADTYRGTADVAILGSPVPASAQGEVSLTDVDGGSEFQLTMTATVAIPMFGDTVEQYIAEQIRRLLDLESAFTQRWLART